MRIAIVGGAGFVGRALVRHFSARHDVVIASRSMPRSTIPGTSMIVMRTNDYTNVGEIMSAISPDVVINAAGFKNVPICELTPLHAADSNTTLTAMLANWCRKFSKKFVHVSTDLVFDGKLGRYTENSVPCPVSVYGRTKLAGEHMAAIAPGALIVRAGGLYNKDTQLVVETISRLSDGMEINGYVNVTNTPTHTSTLAEAIDRLVASDKSGLHHIADNNVASRYDFMTTIARVFKLNEDLIVPAMAVPESMLLPDVSLRSIYPMPEAKYIGDGVGLVKRELCA